jgi:hypothetical protein
MGGFWNNNLLSLSESAIAFTASRTLASAGRSNENKSNDEVGRSDEFLSDSETKIGLELLGKHTELSGNRLDKTYADDLARVIDRIINTNLRGKGQELADSIIKCLEIVDRKDYVEAKLSEKDLGDLPFLSKERLAQVLASNDNLELLQLAVQFDNLAKGHKFLPRLKYFYDLKEKNFEVKFSMLLGKLLRENKNGNGQKTVQIIKDFLNKSR